MSVSKSLSSTPAPKPELKEAFDRAVEQRADALLVHVDALFNDGGGSCRLSLWLRSIDCPR